MKILAMEREVPGVKPEQFEQHRRLEARKVWDLYLAGIIREIRIFVKIVQRPSSSWSVPALMKQSGHWVPCRSYRPG